MCFIATSNLLTRLLVNSSTCQLVNYQYSTTNFANDTNYLAIKIRAIREIRSSYHKVQSSNLKVQRKKHPSANCFQHSPSLSERGLGGEVPPSPIGYIYVK